MLLLEGFSRDSSCNKSQQLADSGEVVVIVFGLEKEHVHQAHGFTQSWMQSCSGKTFGIQLVQSLRQSATRFLKLSQNQIH